MKNIFNKFKKDKNKNKDNSVSSNSGLISINNNKLIKGNLLDTDFDNLPILNVPINNNLIVNINSEPKTGELKINYDDIVSFEFVDHIIEDFDVNYEINVSDDRMSVSINKNVKKGKILCLNNQPFSNYINLELIEVPYNPELTDIEDLMYDLKSEDLVGEIVEENLSNIATSSENLNLVVMKGIEPLNGKEAYYTPLFEEKTINFIAKGEKIAELIQEVPPVPGKDVYGNEIPLILDYELPSIGKFVNKKDNFLFSERDGRLTFDEKLIEITPQLIVHGDLSEKDGPIIFNDGDVVIEGRVLEKSYIKSNGNVYAKDGIYGCKIFAEKGLFVNGNVSGSEIYVGSNKLLLIKARRFLNEITPRIENMQFLGAIKYMNSVYSKEMIRLSNLLDVSLTDEVKLLYKNIKDAIDMTERHFKNINKKSLSDFDKENIMACQEAFRELQMRLDSFTDYEDSKVTTDNITNTTLYASGKIEINGDGTYLSFIESGDKVVVKSKVNGGTTIAENQIEVGEFKSYNTVDFGLIVFDSKGNIRIRKRYPDTTIKVGDTKDVSFDIDYNVNFRETKDDKKNKKDT